MTTDAFSHSFSFEDEKNASTPPTAVPDSSIDNAADNLANETSNFDLAADTTSDDLNTDVFNLSSPTFSNEPEESPKENVDAVDPFAGFSFGFGAEDESLDDLPAEIGTVETSSDSESEAVLNDPFADLGSIESSEPLSSFPQDDLLSATPQSEVEEDVASAADAEQDIFLEAPDFFGNNEVEQGTPDVDAIEEAPIALAETVEADEVADIADVDIATPTSFVEAPEVADVETDNLTVDSDINADAEVEPIVLVTPVKITGKVEADDPFAPFVKEPPHVATVAILGASGIGANHAKWFTKHGCQVVSFLGTTEESIEATNQKLEAQFGFNGQGYTNLEQLLEETKPEIVCVATPSQFHFVHSLAALEAGAHVLCEKPLTYAPARKIRENVAGATELIKLAKKKNLLLGTQLQYGAATPILTKLAGVTPEEVGDFAMEIETTNPSAPRHPQELWIDLGPHAVSIAAFLGGEGALLQENSIQFFPRIEGQMVEASARFSIRREDGRFITVRAITRFAPKDAMWRAPYRRFSFNGRVVSYRGYQTPSGEFAAQFTAPDGYDSHYPDPVDFLIGNFVRAVQGEEELLIDGEFGRQNLEWLLKINS